MKKLNHYFFNLPILTLELCFNSFRSGDAFLQLLRLVIDAFSQRLHSHSDAL